MILGQRGTQFGKEVEAFTEAATRFDMDGQYCPHPKGTLAYKNFWREESIRCKYGYQVDGVRITGEHYQFLNYHPIKRIPKEKVLGVQKKSARSKAQKVGFADFWDLHYDYFWSLEIARNGITKESLDKLNLGVKIIGNYTEGGHNMACPKARAKGISFVNSVCSLNAAYFHPGSTSLYTAYVDDYLTGDGIMPKVWRGADWINNHTAFAHAFDYKNANLEKEWAYKIKTEEGIYTKKGLGSTIIGMVVVDPDKVRGTRVYYLFYEEAGKNPILLKTWNIADRSLRPGDTVVGIQIAFGTGGTKEQDLGPLKQIYDNPETYNCLIFENIWDEALKGTKCGIFLPTYRGYEGYMDKYGNSDTEGVKSLIKKELDLKKRGGDNTTVMQFLAENPSSPAEAFLEFDSSILPKQEILTWERKIVSDDFLFHFGTPIDLVMTKDGVMASPSEKLPIREFPISDISHVDLNGVPVRYHKPVLVDGQVPPNVYFISVDPYAHDKDEDDPTINNSVSLGCAIVWIRVNPYTRPFDTIAAVYLGRPSRRDSFNDTLFFLAEYYNAQIVVENDRGNVEDYAKRQHKLHRLVREFDPRNRKLLGRGYGYSMRNDIVKSEGETYLKDWLLEERGRDEHGNVVLNLHTIYDLRILRELGRYKKKGNFDSVSALFGAMFYRNFTHNLGGRRTESVYKNDYFKNAIS